MPCEIGLIFNDSNNIILVKPNIWEMRQILTLFFQQNELRKTPYTHRKINHNNFYIRIGKRMATTNNGYRNIALNTKATAILSLTGKKSS